MVTFDTGTNFPALSWNFLLAVAMMNIRHRWNGIGVPTQSHPNAASLTLSAWNISQLMYEVSLNSAVVQWLYQLPDKPVLVSVIDDLKSILKTVISGQVKIQDLNKLICHNIHYI